MQAADEMGKVALAINQQKRTNELLSRYMVTENGTPVAGKSVRLPACSVLASWQRADSKEEATFQQT